MQQRVQDGFDGKKPNSEAATTQLVDCDLFFIISANMLD
jgi:hypothetical protein